MAMLTLSDCGSIEIPVQIKDEPLYLLEGQSGAVEIHFLTGGVTDIPKKDWDAMSEGMVAMSEDSWGDFKTEIGKLCTETKCDYVTSAAIQFIEARMDSAYATGRLIRMSRGQYPRPIHN